MKNSLQLIYIILSLGFVTSALSQSQKEKLIGKWQLISKSGGRTGKTINQDSTKAKSIIEFTSDSIYRFYESDSLRFERNYHFIKSKSIYSSRDSVYLLKGAGFGSKSFNIYNNKLILIQECYDCYSFRYRRLSIPNKTKYIQNRNEPNNKIKN